MVNVRKLGVGREKVGVKKERVERMDEE